MRGYSMLKNIKKGTELILMGIIEDSKIGQTGYSFVTDS